MVPPRSPGRGAAALALLTTLAVLAAGCDPGQVAEPLPPLDPEPTAAAPVLAPASASPATPQPAPAALDRVLGGGGLGPSVGAVVLDAVTGETLLDRDGATPRTPASVLKLATAAAASTVLEPGSRLRTRVLRGDPGELVLVGAGDTTLTRAPGRRAYPRRAGLSALADATVAALASDPAAQVRVRVDDSLFAGPAVSPDWPAGYVRSGVVSPVSALSLDGGRVSADSDAREPDPALAAGRAYAGLLRERGLTVAGDVARVAAAATGAEVAAVVSPTVAELVELMLASSDNDLAESLLRLVAVARDRPATFEGGAAVVTEVLTGLGVPVDGLLLLDGSGLARGSRIAPRTLAAVLVLAAGTGSPGPLDHLVTGLPVAGFSGTLSLRYAAGRPRLAAGLVRAKTGTLTGVSTLAGVTVLRSRPVAFVVMADEVGDTLAARADLDRFAAALAVPAAP